MTRRESTREQQRASSPREQLRAPLQALVRSLRVYLNNAEPEHTIATSRAALEDPLDAKSSLLDGSLQDSEDNPIPHGGLLDRYQQFFTQAIAAGMPLHLIQFEFRREEQGRWVYKVALETPAAHQVIDEARAALDQEVFQAMLTAAGSGWNKPGNTKKRLVLEHLLPEPPRFISRGANEAKPTERKLSKDFKALLRRAFDLYAAHGRRLLWPRWAVVGYPDDFDVEASMYYELSFEHEELLAREHEAGSHTAAKKRSTRRARAELAPTWTSGLDGFKMSRGVVKAWTRWEDWLRRTAPRLAATLRGPASDASLRKLEKALRRPLPQQLITLWKLHDGQKGHGLIAGYDFLSVSGVLREWRQWEGLSEMNDELRSSMTSFPRGVVQRAYTSPGWIPLWQEPYEGNYLGLDLAPAEKGTSGQVINFGRDEDEKAAHAPSLEALLEWLATEAEAGRIGVHEKGLTHRDNNRLANVLMAQTRRQNKGRRR